MIIIFIFLTTVYDRWMLGVKASVLTSDVVKPHAVVPADRTNQQLPRQ